ncbi:MAG: outer membrane protein transport protein [Chitinophagaceae bacterium]|jgi:long-chain fatty acid transport protein|nr:outer membrane protein transport protein [Chitinophagaceae bacterium]
MKKLISTLLPVLLPVFLMAQAGHIMQGIGAHNMSMGGAATGNALEVSGALHWNPAGIAAFDGKTLSINAGLFYSSPELSSTVPTPGGPFSGVTQDDRGASVMPALAYVWNKKDSKHHFGVSAFGVSGFGVTFPENMSNPINMPQDMGGFGRIESDYMLLQVGFTYAYEISDQLSIGVAPTFNYGALELAPNPLSSPSMDKGYPVADRASAFGFGGQLGIYYRAENGFRLGASYKTQQFFNDFEFNNTYLDGTAAPNVNFTMNFPSIISIGAGYSKKMFDIAVDYRYVNYANTDGFEAEGWTQTASVAGFGWDNISIVSAGIQYKGVNRLPIRVGYTYSSNPIKPELAFFSTPATAIIANAFQLGLGYEFTPQFTLNAVYHHGNSSGSTSGPLLSPMMVSPTNPNGAIPNSEVSYKMTTDLFMIGLQFTF